MLFSYKAIDKDGVQVTGTLDAPERQQVIANLRARHLTPVQVSVGKPTDLGSYLPKRKPSAKDLSMFCEQFCSLLRAGVNILDALQLLVEQSTGRSSLVEAIQTTMNAINEGEPLATGMSKSPRVFDDTLVNLVRAGEASGSLDKSLERMALQYKKDAEINAAVKKALVYPIIVLVVALIVVTFLVVWIVPKFAAMFADIDLEMPKITLGVMALANWLKAHWLVAAIIVLAVVGVAIAFFSSKVGKRVLSWLAIHVPFINKLIIKSNASKIARTLSTLLTAGMTVIEALTILESTLTNYYYKEALRAIKEDVLTGQPMSKKFKENKKLFPAMLSHMIGVGEDTGDITAMLMKTAEYYDLEVQTATDALMSMLPTIVILMLVPVVGVILAAVLAPMLAMYTQLGDAL